MNCKEENNPNWKGGISTAFYHKIGQIIPKICFECGSRKGLEFHHINNNRKDNRISNLKILCRSCHTKIHNKFKNFHQLNNPKIKGKCLVCGREFEYWKSVRKNARYCSNPCRKKDHSRLLKQSYINKNDKKDTSKRI